MADRRLGLFTTSILSAAFLAGVTTPALAASPTDTTPPASPTPPAGATAPATGAAATDEATPELVVTGSHLPHTVYTSP